MKIRLHHDSIRLRLTPADVGRLRETGTVEAVTHFPSSALRCILRTDRSASQIAAALHASIITVTVPQPMARDWADGEQVGLSQQTPLEAGRTLRILIEKDFECAHDPDPDQAETFYPNPARSRPT